MAMKPRSLLHLSCLRLCSRVSTDGSCLLSTCERARLVGDGRIDRDALGIGAGTGGLSAGARTCVPLSPVRAATRASSRAPNAPAEGAAGAIAMKNCPVLGGPPAVPENGLACAPSTAPERQAAINSTRSAEPTPL